MLEETRKLTEINTQVSDGIQEISEGTAEISGAVVKITEGTVANREAIEAVVAEAAKFTLKE
jgi:methyl-accepting chemotaxis protein